MSTATEEYVEEFVETKDDISTSNGWKVIIHNNDYTPFDLVILGLISIFDLSAEEAEKKAMETHHEGSAVVKTGLTQEDAVCKAGEFRILTKDFGRLKPCLATAEPDE